MASNPFVGKWIYRSLLNDPDISKPFNDLEFASATIEIKEAEFDSVKGTIGGEDWTLELRGSRGYGSPMQIHFRGKGVGLLGEEWIYEYLGWLVPVWPNSTDTLQVPSIVGSVTRIIPHHGSDGSIHPAGVVASFYLVKVDAAN